MYVPHALKWLKTGYLPSLLFFPGLQPDFLIFSHKATIDFLLLL